MAYRTPSSVRTHVSVPTSDDPRVKDVRELRVDAQRLLDSRERDEPEEQAAEEGAEGFAPLRARQPRGQFLLRRRSRAPNLPGLDAEVARNRERSSKLVVVAAREGPAGLRGSSCSSLCSWPYGRGIKAAAAAMHAIVHASRIVESQLAEALLFALPSDDTATTIGQALMAYVRWLVGELRREEVDFIQLVAWRPADGEGVRGGVLTSLSGPTPPTTLVSTQDPR